jgi:hypothetical protein
MVHHHEALYAPTTDDESTDDESAGQSLAWSALATTVTPRQLPAAGGTLVGRAAHLSWLDELLLGSEDRQARIAVLTGMAGAGKTALAVQ